MASPSERYAAARLRRRYHELTSFRSLLVFELDQFQISACEALEDGRAVLVCAPTGAGKTVVGEFAVHLALATGRKCFYTTPIKALSNQKYNDLVARYGERQVGLLTGDNSVNPDAPVVVMTTEVLRNMLYVGSTTLSDLGYVVMDEVHYLGDRFRGAVWEEVIIHLPLSVRLVSLSATVSNSEEFGDWLMSVRGETTVIVHEQRPVPLWQHMMVGTRMFDLFGTANAAAPAAATAVNPELTRYIGDRLRQLEPVYPRHGRGAPRRVRGWRPPYRPDVLARLDSEGMLPAITFIFSRAGCDAAVRQCIATGLWLTTSDERDEIDTLVDAQTTGIAGEDLEVLGYWEWRDGLRRGVAAHHAGLLPVFKETVERLFVRGLVRAVFATETLALGINMPARSVVLERLTKFNGEAHVDVTPGEYTQLTGRAGRRGIDVEGHAVVLWHPDVDPGRVAGLASARTYPLRSSFQPSYNMAVNLVDHMGRSPARQLLESSFAQFQADRGVAGLVAQIRRNENRAAEYLGRMSCERGDFAAYADLRRRLTDREREVARSDGRARRAAAVSALQSLKAGDVIRVPSGRRSGIAVVLDPGLDDPDDPHPLVLTDGRWSGRLSLTDFPAEVLPLASLRVPKRFNHRSPKERRDMASRLRELDLAELDDSARAGPDPDSAGQEEVGYLRAAIRAHACHGCPDREEHARWAEQRSRLTRENDTLRGKIEGRTGSLGRTFDSICALLDERGFLAGDETTPAGRQLARIWSESDLLTAECLRAGSWDRLGPAELAAVVSALAYEPRREERPTDGVPTAAIRTALTETTRIWAQLADDESALGLPRTRQPEPGFAWPMYRWADGQSLDKVLSAAARAGTDITAGDFVRWCKQVLDLLEQLASVPPPTGTVTPVGATARAAVALVRRGVVAQSMQM